MSFASDVKTELCTSRPALHEHQLAQVYGLLLYSKRFDAGRMELQIEHEPTARLYCEAILDEVGITTSLSMTEYPRQNGVTQYLIEVDAREDRESILQYFGHSPSEGTPRVNMRNIASREGLAAFVSGAFLACGNVTDPRKSYQLEFVCPTQELARDLSTLISTVFSAPKLTARRNDTVAYFKESERVEELLTYMGAPKAALRMMDVQVLKDVRNKVNRATNCETANLDKTINASAEQIEDIRYIQHTRGLGWLPPELQEIAALRLDNPELSLRELAGELDEPISRSGANHRLKKISQLAAELRQEER